MRITKGQLDEIKRVILLSEIQLESVVMDGEQLSKIREKLGCIITDIKPPKFFKRLL